MTIQFKTNTVYTLSSRGLVFKLECTYIEENTVWFVCNDYKPSTVDGMHCKDHYKLDRKTSKLFKLNNAFSSWDSIENTLSEDKVEDIWQARSTHRYAYDGMNQDD